MALIREFNDERSEELAEVKIRIADLQYSGQGKLPSHDSQEQRATLNALSQ